VSRADFDSRSPKPLLTNISIVERLAAGEGAWRDRFRLAGTAMAGLSGEATGRRLDEFISAPCVER
jgi:hypothetical protein